MKKSLFLFIYLIISSFAFGLPEDPTEYAQWESRTQESIQKQSGAPPSEAIPKLGEWLRKLSRKGTPQYELNPDRPVFKAAQAALLSIPGHAEYYRDRLNEARLQFEAADKPGDENITNRGITQHQLLNEQMYGFATLSQLPSVETVQVLGEFLSDERGRMIVPPDYKGSLRELWENTWGQKPNSTEAAHALNNLPLKSKPVNSDPRYPHEEDLRSWQLWYNQIKAGNRTFSFEGDPTEYNLRGPAREALSPDIPRATKRPSHQEAATKVGDDSRSFSSNTPAISAILVALLIGGGYWIYRRKASSHS